ncbi:phytoene desaturase family protein [Frigoriglobus tundricola]|uniref:NAD(P)/FAD-dependent oxidoreductase n=1 Tax=Frigoriglobus tundricola TaxID=2774151 RepID=A0A6M5YY90_9BACT|nr:NAD(P)/FAD-dependent oxidoreductase [Frigoriglobus tundricola]QJW99087.1 NAD(P)/FAD-dependent oxidoreductase [Frigoriglobus tundricola]
MSDVVVIGSGPNGLAAAITLAQQGYSVLVVEAAETVGGGTRSAALTLPGFVHDVCSAVHPMAVASPFFQSLPLADHSLEWVHPETPFAHPVTDHTAVALERSVDATADALGPDARAYRRLMAPLAAGADGLFRDLLGPFGIPRHPFLAMRFGLQAIRSAAGLAESWFRTAEARALVAGLAAHAVMPLERSPTAAIALMLGVAGHAVGWPFPRGGAQKLADALAAYLRALGGRIELGRTVESIDEFPAARAILLDVTPRQVVALAGHKLPGRYGRALARYRYGPGVFKVDWALSGPIPWRAAECRRAGTVHVGGTLEEVAESERAPWRGEHPDRPFVLLAQPSVFDPTRAPDGKHTAWGYCHVPNGSTVDMTERIEAQVERFAPGFRDLVLARHTMNTVAMQAHNPNYIGGDITGGVADWWQLFTRPVARLNPYTTPLRNVYICSASTPPGGGVHGMCGYFAARAAARRLQASTL